MSTFRQLAVHFLVSNGMTDANATAVMADVTAAPANSPMLGRWDESADDYPPAMRAVMLVTVRHAALAWIDKHIPKAWFRPLFAATDEPMVFDPAAGV